MSTTVTIPDLHPYKVERQPDGRWACVAPLLGVIPEWIYDTPDAAISRARANLREDNE